MGRHKTFRKGSRRAYRFLIVLCALAVIAAIVALYFGGPLEEMELPVEDQKREIPDPSIDSQTGFIKDQGMNEVIANCTSCHAAELVTQNRMSREAWLSTIRWMQESQNLWNLGANEDIILDYLAKNYAPKEQGRRQPLTDIKWYVLED